MSEKTATGVSILAAAFAAGVLGDYLLHGVPPGINVLSWAAVLVAVVLVTTRGQAVVSRRDDAAGALALIVFAADFAWRDSFALRLLDLGALGIVVSLAALRAPVSRLAISGLAEYFKASVIACLRAALDPLALLFKDIRWAEAVRPGWPRQALRVTLGTALAAPPLAIFLALLMAADVVFRRIVVNTLSFNVMRLLGHILFIGFLAWIVAGTLRGILFGNAKPAAESSSSRSGALGITEIGVALGLVDALFLCFVVVELRYFFGGASLVKVVPGLTYAEYARHGFFELCAVSALVSPLLLGAHWLLRPEKSAHERIFRGLAGLQTTLVFVIMLSAIERMRLYEHEYGLTELRLYTTAFMGWLALVLVWFLLTVLRGHRERFAFGAMIAGLAGILILHVMNPDALIARRNIARATGGRKFDAAYVASLSADAVPTLIESLPELKPADRSKIACELRGRLSLTKPIDWRTWNLSRWQARRAFQRSEASLPNLYCACN